MSNARNLARLLPNASGQLPDANLAAIAANKLSGRLPDANAPTGSVIQVVTNYPTSAAMYSQSVSGWTEISADYRTTITPSANNSILVLEWIGSVGGNCNGAISTMKFFDITNTSDVGLAGLSLGSRGIGHGSFRQVDTDSNDRDNILLRAVIQNTNTNSRTYSLFHYSENANTRYFNATTADNSGCSYVKWHFTITEILP